MTILDTIIETKRHEIAEQVAQMPRAEHAAQAEAFSTSRTIRPFRALFDTSSAGVVIAEIKPRSPSAGVLIEGSPLAVAELYARSKADVVSFLTDKQYFGGDIALLKEARARLSQPVLRKDFIIDPYQVYESALAEADAFLLIAAVLETNTLTELIRIGESLSLDALVEVHDEAELDRALAAGAKLIGINNRNLKTMEVDLSLTERLAGLVPKEIPVVSESGTSTADDIRRLRACGVRGVLVGTSILKSSDPVAKIAELKNAFL